MARPPLHAHPSAVVACSRAPRRCAQSPAVHCAATAAALCESAMLLGLSLFEETAAVALPRVRSAGRLAAERACGLAAQVQATLDDAQAALDAKRGSAWLRAVLKARQPHASLHRCFSACAHRC